MENAEYIQIRLENQITWYGDESNWCQKRFKAHRIIQIVLAASLPVMASMDCLENWFPIIASVFGALISVSVSVAALCKYHEHWTQYRTTAEMLKHEKYMYLTKAGKYANNKPLALLVERVESLISKEHTQWDSHQRSHN